MRYTNQFDPSRLIQVSLCPMVNGIILLDNQRVNDFKDLAPLDGIKIAYDLCVEENLNREMIFYSRYWLLYSAERHRRQIEVLLNTDWRRSNYEK
jgi:hypothetical protein